MPELPDVELYVKKLTEQLAGHRLNSYNILGPSVLRTVTPPLDGFVGRSVAFAQRLEKRIAIVFDDGTALVFHLMIAGRFRWVPSGTRLPRKITSAAFDFDDGTLALTEAATRKRAVLHAMPSMSDAGSLLRGGADPLVIGRGDFEALVGSVNRTLKRFLTDQSLLAGIGNAYSDEILFAARLSPLRLTKSLDTEEVSRLYDAMQKTLREWVERLQVQFADRFPGPGEITAFRPEFAVHGKFGSECRVCGHKVQRIRYAENETNYCAKCQNEGRLLADRALSRLLKDDWPRTLEELES